MELRPELLPPPVARERIDALSREMERICDLLDSRSPYADQAASAISDFNADAHLESLAHLASLGVTWVQVELPGDSLEHAIEVAQRYGEQVIDSCFGSTR